MDYNADIPTDPDYGMPTYCIYRDIRPGEPFDPSAPLQFLPPKDSDELFDALRFAFPHLKTHSERLRDATIKFLHEEQQFSMSPAPTPTPVPGSTKPSLPTVAASSSRTVSSSSRSAPSNRLNVWNHATVGTKGKFKRSQSPNSNSHASSLLTPDMPPQDEMTGVFSISAAQPKQHQRRKMTEKEKADYRRRRAVKACDQCAKRKRKCNHTFIDNLGSGYESSMSPGDSSASTRGGNHSPLSHSQREENNEQEYGAPYDQLVMEKSDSESSSTWPNRGPSFGHKWNPHGRMAAGPQVGIRAGLAGVPVMRVDECLLLEELVAQHWGMPWTLDKPGRVDYNLWTNDEDERRLSGESQCFTDRPLSVFAEQHPTAMYDAITGPCPRRGPGRSLHDEKAYDEQYDDYRSRSIYHGIVVQKLEKDSSMAATDASLGSESLEEGEMLTNRSPLAAADVLRYEALVLILRSSFDSILTQASMVAAVASVLQTEHVMSLGERPNSQSSEDMQDSRDGSGF